MHGATVQVARRAPLVPVLGVPGTGTNVVARPRLPIRGLPSRRNLSVARPLDNPYVNQWLLGVRERQGQRIIAKKGATEDITTELERGGVVAFIADQNAGP